MKTLLERLAKLEAEAKAVEYEKQRGKILQNPVWIELKKFVRSLPEERRGPFKTEIRKALEAKLRLAEMKWRAYR